MAKEVPLNDAELDALMAELEAETGVTAASVPAPTPKASPVATPAPAEDDAALAALEAELSSTTPVGAPIAELQAEVANLGQLADKLESDVAAAVATVTETGVDSELAALEAELSGLDADEPPTPVSTPAPAEPAGEAEIDAELQALEAAIEKPAVVAEPAPVTVSTTVEVTSAPPGATASKDYASALKSCFTELSSNELFIDPHKFKVETAVSETNLDNCMIEQNGLRSHYGALAARSEHYASKQKLKFEIIESKLYEEHRRLAIEEGEKPTEKMIEARLRQDPRWIRAKTAQIDANGISDINRALVESLKDRKDMLVQLGADRRDEMKGQTRVVERQAETRHASELLKGQM